MHRPSMMFSAAHSGLLEAQEASRQVRAQEDAQPRFLWKRGFHMEGGRAGWGYYLEPVPLEAGSTDEEGAEESVGDTAVDDEQDLDAPSELYLAGESGERKRLEEWTTPGYYLESTWPRLVSHGRLVSHASQLLERFPKMAPKTHSVVSLWFALTIPVIFWDVGYCFLRPRSMVGGDLHWIWKPYALYQEVDYVYGVKALENGDGFTNAQSLLNVVENCMNIGYLYLAHVSGSPVAPLLGFASATMTLSKTVLYWLQEYYCGFCQIGHNDFQTLVLYWIIPNGLWLLVPSYIIYVLTKDITSALRVANAAGKKTKKQ